MVGVLSACSHLAALNQGQSIHDYIVRNRLRMNVYVGTALIDMYAKCGDIDEAKQVFDTMGVKKKKNCTWNVLISGYAMNGKGEAALQDFDRMVVEEFKPDDVTFMGVLCACKTVEECRRRFSSMINQFGLQPKIVHYGCMIDLFGRGGLLDEAMEMIHSMKLKPDAIIWRTLVRVCRFHGREELSEFALRKLLELEPTNGENYVSIEIENAVYEFKASDPLKMGHEVIHKMLEDLKNQLKLAGYVPETEMALYDINKEEKEHNLIYLHMGCYIHLNLHYG
ncbi:putative pentatricopeptide repeat-containing protein At5g40405 [Lycium ferocissimum]|uniref:putative pentatricopeptide repeat-containing protein At5g40405 n=1 Tax=Lycium ferocissimum TaxID=112874 RepID=UPI00281607C7|nr:putative pentatricopeptide repeat-containing protein At5g40405 [Lycium ferocissimum]